MKLKSFTVQGLYLDFSDYNIIKISGENTNIFDTLKMTASIITCNPIMPTISFTKSGISPVVKDSSYDLSDECYEIAIEFEDDSDAYVYSYVLENGLIKEERLEVNESPLLIAYPKSSESFIFKCDSDEIVYKVRNFCRRFSFISSKIIHDGSLPYRIVDHYYDIKGIFHFWEDDLSRIKIDGLDLHCLDDENYYFLYKGKRLDNCSINTLIYLYSLIAMERSNVMFFSDVDEYTIFKILDSAKPDHQFIYMMYPYLQRDDIKEIQLLNFC